MRCCRLFSCWRHNTTKSVRSFVRSYLSVLCINLGVSTGDDFGLEGDPVGHGLFVSEASDFEDKAFGHILVDNIEME